MDVIIAALITTVGALISTLLIVFKDHLASLFSWKRRKWVGLWKGTAHCNDTDRTYQITVRLKQTGRIVSGTLTSHSPDSLEYRIKGKIHEPEFMTYYAENADPEAINYFVGVLRLARAADRITGGYLARSRLVEGISSGKIDLSLAKGGSTSGSS